MECLRGLTTGSVPGCTTSDVTEAAAFSPGKVMFSSEALSVCLNNWMGSGQGRVGRELEDCSFNYKPFLCGASFETGSRVVHMMVA